MTDDLKPKMLIELNTPAGHMQVLEYVMQDYSWVHVIQWYYSNVLNVDNNFPKIHCETFHKQKNDALKLAEKIGIELLKCY